MTGQSLETIGYDECRLQELYLLNLMHRLVKDEGDACTYAPSDSPSRHPSLFDLYLELPRVATQIR